MIDNKLENPNMPVIKKTTGVLLRQLSVKLNTISGIIGYSQDEQNESNLNFIPCIKNLNCFLN